MLALLTNITVFRFSILSCSAFCTLPISLKEVEIGGLPVRLAFTVMLELPELDMLGPLCPTLDPPVDSVYDWRSPRLSDRMLEDAVRRRMLGGGSNVAVRRLWTQNQ